MATITYIRNIFLLGLLLLVCLALYPIFSENTPIVLRYNNSAAYTTQGTMLVTVSLFSIVFYTFLKFAYLLAVNLFFIPNLCRSVILYILTFFGIGNDKNNILNQINELKKQKKYRKALIITRSNFMSSNEVLFQHLFLLLKLKKVWSFFRMFKKYPCGKAIPLLIAQINKWSKWRRNRFYSSLYNKNKDSDIFAYLYAKNLFENKEYAASYKITRSFIENKIIFFRDHYTFYLFNKLALKLEMIESEGSTDFATTYIENIQNYHDAILQKKK